jgi:PAS domain S-box-containing protein
MHAAHPPPHAYHMPAAAVAPEANEFMSVLTLDGVFTFASGECEALFGLLPADLQGRSVYEYVLGEDLYSLTQLHRTAVERQTDLSANRAIVRVRALLAPARPPRAPLR